MATLAPAWEDKGPLDESVASWLSTVWPLINARERTIIESAVLRVQKSFVVGVNVTGSSACNFEQCAVTEPDAVLLFTV